MKLLVFDYNHNLGLDHEIKYLDQKQIGSRPKAEILQEIKDFKPDLIIEREFNDGKSNYSFIYKSLPNVPKCWWCIDAHTNLIQHVVYAKQFDFVFCAQSWFIPLFQNQIKGQIFFLPLSHTQSLPDYEDWLAKEPPARDIEFSFVGNIRSIHVERAKMVMSFIESLGDKFLAATIPDYNEMLITLQRSKLTFNCSLNEDLNLRVWEALAMNTPLMTDYVADLNYIKGLPELISVIYPRTTDKRIEQTINIDHGDTSEFIRTKHTLTHRYNQLLMMFFTRKQMEF